MVDCRVEIRALGWIASPLPWVRIPPPPIKKPVSDGSFPEGVRTPHHPEPACFSAAALTHHFNSLRPPAGVVVTTRALRAADRAPMILHLFAARILVDGERPERRIISDGGNDVPLSGAA